MKKDYIYFPDKARFLAKFMRELIALSTAYKYPKSGVPEDFLKIQAATRALGYKNIPAEKAMKVKLFGGVAPKPVIAPAPRPATKPAPITTTPTIVVQPVTKPLPVLQVMPAPRKRHVQITAKKVGMLPAKKDCTCKTKEEIKVTADGFWSTELGKAILNNPIELAKFKANPEGYLAAIKTIGPDVEHIKDIASFFGCNASNEDIKRYLRGLELRAQVTSEHIALTKQTDFRKATISKLDSILHKLPSTISANQAVLLIRNACGIG
jgi:hypothetical protein